MCIIKSHFIDNLMKLTRLNVAVDLSVTSIVLWHFSIKSIAQYIFKSLLIKVKSLVYFISLASQLTNFIYTIYTIISPLSDAIMNVLSVKNAQIFLYNTKIFSLHYSFVTSLLHSHIYLIWWIKKFHVSSLVKLDINWMWERKPRTECIA
jgi:hypothetical protein